MSCSALFFQSDSGQPPSRPDSGCCLAVLQLSLIPSLGGISAGCWALLVLFKILHTSAARLGMIHDFCIQSLVLEKRSLVSWSCLAEVFTIPSQRMGRRKFEILAGPCSGSLVDCHISWGFRACRKSHDLKYTCFLLLVLFLSRSR